MGFVPPMLPHVVFDPKHRLLTGNGPQAMDEMVSRLSEILSFVPAEAMSIGSEHRDGIPKDVFLALPFVFQDKIPVKMLSSQNLVKGYEPFGMVYREKNDLSIGFSERESLGMNRVSMNCFLCHTSTYRENAGDARQFFLGGASSRLDLQSYLRFLFSTADDPRFQNGALANKIIEMRAQQGRPLSWTERRVLNNAVIPATQAGLKVLKRSFSWMASRPDWMAGRIDPFNPVKFHPLVLGMDSDRDTSIGNSKMMDLWGISNQRGNFHADGLNDNLTEVVYSSAIGDGAIQFLLDHWSLQLLEQWILRLDAPKFPLNIDEALASKGHAIFKQHCAECHSEQGARFNQIIPLQEVKTDSHRLEMWNAEAAEKYNKYIFNRNYRFTRFRKTDGYVAVDLKGIWLRGPYLHNGSVANINELLTTAADRTSTFCIGYDVLDPVNLGFVTSGATACKEGFVFQVAQPGNSNQGHEYGTLLHADQKRALVEYLKTL
jgi:hypothetical protein